jgi:adenylate cyclase class IV
MEYEVRFYYPSSEVNNLLDKLSELKELEKKPRTYEKTVQYNHSDSRYDFYSKEIDGRFRLRLSKNIEESKCKLSWKRRLPNTTENLVNKEKEKEVRISYDDVDNFIFIIENVMHFKVVDSYERYRTIFTNEDVEISIDEYPFGIALEIENKSSTKNPEEVVMNYASKLKLNIKDSYRLSWDDKYVELCKEQNKEIYNEVTFDKDMPSI